MNDCDIVRQLIVDWLKSQRISRPFAFKSLSRAEDDETIKELAENIVKKLNNSPTSQNDIV